MTPRQKRPLILLTTLAVLVGLTVMLPAQQPTDPRGWAYSLDYYSGDLSKAAKATTRKYLEAESDDERTQAEEELHGILAKRFDELAKQRAQQLADLRARLEQLEQQLQQRRQAKDEIVELRLKVVISEAKGLGFYPNGQSDSTLFDNIAQPAPGLQTINPEPNIPEQFRPRR